MNEHHIVTTRVSGRCARCSRYILGLAHLAGESLYCSLCCPACLERQRQRTKASSQAGRGVRKQRSA